MRPRNKYLEGLECIASYSFKILKHVLEKSPETTIEAALYAFAQHVTQEESNQRLADIQQQLKDRILTSLNSSHHTVSNRAW